MSGVPLFTVARVGCAGLLLVQGVGDHDIWLPPPYLIVRPLECGESDQRTSWDSFVADTLCPEADRRGARKAPESWAAACRTRLLSRSADDRLSGARLANYIGVAGIAACESNLADLARDGEGAERHWAYQALLKLDAPRYIIECLRDESVSLKLLACASAHRYAIHDQLDARARNVVDALRETSESRVEAVAWAATCALHAVRVRALARDGELALRASGVAPSPGRTDPLREWIEGFRSSWGDSADDAGSSASAAQEAAPDWVLDVEAVLRSHATGESGDVAAYEAITAGLVRGIRSAAHDWIFRSGGSSGESYVRLVDVRDSLSEPLLDAVLLEDFPIGPDSMDGGMSLLAQGRLARLELPAMLWHWYGEERWLRALAALAHDMQTESAGLALAFTLDEEFLRWGELCGYGCVVRSAWSRVLPHLADAFEGTVTIADAYWSRAPREAATAVVACLPHASERTRVLLLRFLQRTGMESNSQITTVVEIAKSGSPRILLHTLLALACSDLDLEERAALVAGLEVDVAPDDPLHLAMDLALAAEPAGDLLSRAVATGNAELLNFVLRRDPGLGARALSEHRDLLLGLLADAAPADGEELLARVLQATAGHAENGQADEVIDFLNRLSHDHRGLAVQWGFER